MTSDWALLHLYPEVLQLPAQRPVFLPPWANNSLPKITNPAFYRQATPEFRWYRQSLCRVHKYFCIVDAKDPEPTNRKRPRSLNTNLNINPEEACIELSTKSFTHYFAGDSSAIN